ncbi:MAG TPA: AraC family transcriptional regulator [Acidobacteriota bacterium]|nr:AraC family transcriptional regulator [Acidobacteriota bacterium]
MNAEVRVLFRAPAVRVLDFRCREEPQSVSPAEQYPEYEISFTRTGHFQFRGEHGLQEIDSRYVMLANAGCERVVSHGKDVRDECTILQIPRLLLEEAERIFWRKGILPARSACFPFPRAAVPVTPLLDLLHRNLLRGAGTSTLQQEEITLRILSGVFRQIYDWQTHEQPLCFDEKLRDQHLETVERAKEYMLANLDQDVSLRDIARHARVSEFYFSRLFRKLTSLSPYRYLVEARLDQAAILLKDEKDSVTEICFASGFRSFPHFVASFTARHGISPLQYRKGA